MQLSNVMDDIGIIRSEDGTQYIEVKMQTIAANKKLISSSSVNGKIKTGCMQISDIDMKYNNRDIKGTLYLYTGNRDLLYMVGID